MGRRTFYIASFIVVMLLGTVGRPLAREPMPLRLLLDREGSETIRFESADLVLGKPGRITIAPNQGLSRIEWFEVIPVDKAKAGFKERSLPVLAGREAVTLTELRLAMAGRDEPGTYRFRVSALSEGQDRSSAVDGPSPE